MSEWFVNAYINLVILTITDKFKGADVTPDIVRQACLENFGSLPLLVDEVNKTFDDNILDPNEFDSSSEEDEEEEEEPRRGGGGGGYKFRGGAYWRVFAIEKVDLVLRVSTDPGDTTPDYTFNKTSDAGFTEGVNRYTPIPRIDYGESDVDEAFYRLRRLLLPYHDIRSRLIKTRQVKSVSLDSVKFLAAFTQQLLHTLFTMGHQELLDDDLTLTITPYHMAKRITTYRPYHRQFYKLIQKLGAEIDLRTTVNSKVFTFPKKRSGGRGEQLPCRSSGKEPSPEGFGRCARLEIEGTKARGTDGNMWEVFRDKNNRLYWKKENTGSGGWRWWEEQCWRRWWEEQRWRRWWEEQWWKLSSG